MFIWLQEIEDNWQWPYSQTSSPVWGGEGENLRISIIFPGKTPKQMMSFSSIAQVRSTAWPNIWIYNLATKKYSSKQCSACISVFMCAVVCQLILNDCLCQETVPSHKFLAQAKSWNQKPGRRLPVLPVGPDAVSTWRFTLGKFSSQDRQVPAPTAAGSSTAPALRQPRARHPPPAAPPFTYF